MSEYVQIYDNTSGVPRVKCLRDVNDTPAANPVRYAGIAVPRTSLTEEVLQTQNTIHVSTFFYSGPGNPLVSVVKQGFTNAKLLGVIPNDPLHYVTPSEVADAVKVAIATNYDPATKQISFVDAAGNVIPVFAGGLEHNAAGANGGASSGAGTTASPLTIRIATNSVTGIAYATRATNIPTDMNRDDSDISTAAVKKMMQYIKPVASASGLNAEQLSTNAIEVPMFSNFSCNAGTRGAPRFTVPIAGGGSCAIDLGNLPYYSVDNPPPGGGPFTPGQVVFNGKAACVALPPGVYNVMRAPNAVMGATLGPHVHILTGGDFSLSGNYAGNSNLQCAAPVVSMNGGFAEAGPLMAGTGIGWGWHPAGGGILGAAMIITYVGGI